MQVKSIYKFLISQKRENLHAEQGENAQNNDKHGSNRQYVGQHVHQGSELFGERLIGFDEAAAS